MKTSLSFRRAAARRSLAGLAAALFATASFAHASIVTEPAFASTNSVSDILGVAHDTDPLLVDPWGLTPGPEGYLHVNNYATGVNAHYAPGGALITGSDTPHAFTIPQAATTSGTIGFPTGIVLDKVSYLSSGTGDFVITGTGGSGPSNYLIATEDGAICGYNKNVDAAKAIKGVDLSGSGAGYTGVALSFVTGTDGLLKHRLYAANFAAGRVDVFKPDFSLANTGTGAFVDPDLPTPPNGESWSPFNVHHIAFIGTSGTGTSEALSLQRRILVAYALHSGTTPLIDIPGDGAVAVFLPDGTFIRELAPAGSGLSSPWGMAISHVPVGRFGAKAFVLVGNHGSGRIDAYAFNAGVHDGNFIATLMNDDGNPLAFDGLWALHFGPKIEPEIEFVNDVDELHEDDVNLYFSAGIVNESHGLVGKIVFQHLR